MIKIENVDIHGFKAAIRGMRNSFNSWNKSDSYETFIEDKETLETAPFEFFIGENDLDLMEKLTGAGTDHSKFMRMINVTLDITAPLYWWKEFDTYKVGTVANSCSTMHKIADKVFTREDFSCEHLFLDVQDGEIIEDYVDALESVICDLNFAREKYIETGNKRYWYVMIQLLPSSYNQRRTVQLNYEVLRNIYNSRKFHKLDEWVHFCDWIETLPYSELIIK